MPPETAENEAEPTPRPEHIAMGPTEEAIRVRGRQLIEAGYTVVPMWGIVEGAEGFECACGDENCRRPGKHPWTPRGRWVRVSDQGTWEATCERLDTAGVAANLAIEVGHRRSAEGEVRFGVLDIDSGAEGIRALSDRIGPSAVRVLDQTPTEQSGRVGGGWHVFIGLDYLGVPNAADIGGIKGVELKGDGSLIHVAPSMHASGGRYRPCIALENPIQPAPPELLGILPPDAGLVDQEMAENAVAFGCEPGEIAALAAKLGGAFPKRLNGWVNAAAGAKAYTDLWAEDDGRKRRLNKTLFSAAQLMQLGLIDMDRLEALATPPPGVADDLVSAGIVSETLASAIKGAKRNVRRQQRGLLPEMVDAAEARGIEVPAGLVRAYRRPMADEEIAERLGADAGVAQRASAVDDKTYWGALQGLAGVLAQSREKDDVEGFLRGLMDQDDQRVMLEALAAYKVRRTGAVPGSDPIGLLVADLEVQMASAHLLPAERGGELYREMRDRVLARLAPAPTPEPAPEPPESVRSAEPPVSTEATPEAPNPSTKTEEVIVDTEQLHTLTAIHGLVLAMRASDLHHQPSIEDGVDYLATFAKAAPRQAVGLVAAAGEQLEVPGDPERWLAKHLTVEAQKHWPVRAANTAAAFRHAAAMGATVLGIEDEVAAQDAIIWDKGSIHASWWSTDATSAFLAVAAAEMSPEAQAQLDEVAKAECKTARASSAIVAAARRYDPLGQVWTPEEALAHATATARRAVDMPTHVSAEGVAYGEAYVATAAAMVQGGTTLGAAIATLATDYPSATEAVAAHLESTVGSSVPAEAALAYSVYRSAAGEPQDMTEAVAELDQKVKDAWPELASFSPLAVTAQVGMPAEDVEGEARFAHLMVARVLDPDPRVKAAAHEAVGKEIVEFIEHRVPKGARDRSEVVSAANLRAWEHIHDWDPLRGNVGQWLSGSVLRKATSEQARHERRNVSLDDNVRILRTIPDRAPSPEATLVGEETEIETKGLVSRAMAYLSPELRDVVNKRYDLGPERPKDEVAADLRDAEDALRREDERRRLTEALYQLRKTPEMVAGRIIVSAKPEERMAAFDVAVAEVMKQSGMPEEYATELVDRVEAAISPETAAERAAKRETERAKGRGASGPVAGIA